MIANTLVALNAVGTGSAGPSCSGTFDSGGHNMRTTSDPGCSGFTAGGDLVNPHPRIGQLAFNGGATRTIALLKGSPAINQAGQATSETRDQRGFRRDEKPDVGAFEFGAKS